MRIGILILIIVTVIIGVIAKIVNKKRMRGALGREVGDHELTSLNSWMEVHEKEGQKPQVNPPA